MNSHECTEWCGDGVHGAVMYGPTVITVGVTATFPTGPARVLSCEPAPDAPLDANDPDTKAWLVRWQPTPEQGCEGKRYTEDDLYLKLKGARERLCVAQVALGQGVGAGPVCIASLQEALDRIDQVGAFLPQWSKFDLPHVEDPTAER